MSAAGQSALQRLLDESRQVTIHSVVAAIKNELHSQTAWVGNEIKELEAVRKDHDRVKEPPTSPEGDSGLMAENVCKEHCEKTEVVMKDLDRAKESPSTPEVDRHWMGEKGFGDLRDAALAAVALACQRLTAPDMDFECGPNLLCGMLGCHEWQEGLHVNM